MKDIIIDSLNRNMISSFVALENKLNDFIQRCKPQIIKQEVLVSSDYIIKIRVVYK